ncbi:MAG: geranylgeranylglycerol-phosphate geranylgeranyltransferase, partial [Melioribacteraceae bacterium]|nr:geranylgeranylglycerol-phosphate geranylgeranyltransferase [Melioribacteraceae bacterium]
SFVAAAGNIINDYFDIEIDRINRPDRVLPSGELSIRFSINLYLIISASALYLSSLINLESIVIVIISSLIILLYSYKLKGTPLVGNFIVAFLTGLAFIYGSIAVDNFLCGIIPALFALLINFMREIVKDIEDMKGDKAAEILTYPIRRGVDASITIVIFTAVLLIISTIIPFILKIYRIEYFIFVMPVVNGLLVYIIRELKRDQSQINLRKISNLLKLNMVLGLIAIILGSGI